MDRTLANYSNYVMKDNNISTEQKQNALKDVNKITHAVNARRKLAEKLLDYEKKRSLYLNVINFKTKSPTSLRIIEKPFRIPQKSI